MKYQIPMTEPHWRDDLDLHALLDYDPATGLFRWKQPRGRQAPDWFRGNRRGKCGYRRILFANGLTLYAHRVAWYLMTGAWPPHELDHRNRDRSDNRWNNLRAATRLQNAMNLSLRRTSSTGVRGVTTFRGQFYVHLRAHKKTHFLGLYDTLEEATAARRAAEQRYFGEFASVE
jgi:hypothetical protein